MLGEAIHNDLCAITEPVEEAAQNLCYRLGYDSQDAIVELVGNLLRPLVDEVIDRYEPDIETLKALLRAYIVSCSQAWIPSNADIAAHKGEL